MNARSAASAFAAFAFGLAGPAFQFVLTERAWAQAPGERPFDIAAQPLSRALLEFARQAEVEVFVEHDAIEGVVSAPVRGRMSPQTALSLMLANSGFEGEIHEGAVRLRAARQAPQPAPQPTRRRAQPSSPAFAISDAIVVVGTNIRGRYPASSPVDFYTAAEIARTGAVRSEQFVDVLTQNLDTRSQFGIGAVAALNVEGVNGIDLRGLGVGTSLVLLNGRRLPLASEGQVVDLSLIPLGAIERVEVLTDGASAIYGSDAIGGVVNFVSRRGFEGHETRFDYGGVFDGGLREGGISHSVGHAGDRGEAFVSFETRRASALERTDRDYPAPRGRGDLSPDEHRHSVVGAFSFNASERLTLSGDLIAARRTLKSEYGFLNNQPLSMARTETESVFVSASGVYLLNDANRASLIATYSNRDDGVREITETPFVVMETERGADYASLDLTAKFDGQSFIGGFAFNYSLGFGQVEEQFRTSATNGELGQQNRYAFAEALVPLIGADDGIPWVERLEFNAAVRHTDYEDQSAPPLGVNFGDRTNTKFGALWAPVDWLSLRASFSQSFRAPSLTELDPRRRFNALIRFPLRGQDTIVLGVFGPGDLAPETAETWTMGFDFAPASSALRIRGSYFNIAYEGRVAVPDPTLGIAALTRPDEYSDIVFSTISAELVEGLLRSTRNAANMSGIDLTNPEAAAAQLVGLANFVVFDDRLRNLASVEVDGFDLDVAYGFSSALGAWNSGARLTFMSDYREQITPNARAVTMVDTVLRPVDLRGSAFVELVRDRFEASVSVNYVDDYRNPYAPSPEKIDAWVTWDGRIGWRLSAGTQLSLSVRNIFDENAPYVSASLYSGQGLQGPIGFDPANANPLGRSFSVGLIRTW